MVEIRAEIILTVGLPLSGKSTWARQQNMPMVNPDSIRLALHGRQYEGLAEPFVWAIAYAMARALILAGHTQIIVDATNTTRKRRDEWRERLGDIADIICHPVVEGATKCIDRAMMRNDFEIVPIIKRMDAQYEPLGPDEPVLNQVANEEGRT